ncbi:MAG: hypothetical protein JJU06_05920 [Ectothiorhodospiraceae bacterium]|nr:hypothetical protein [Ectothiorhodospiraceae bacterium]
MARLNYNTPKASLREGCNNRAPEGVTENGERTARTLSCSLRAWADLSDWQLERMADCLHGAGIYATNYLHPEQADDAAWFRYLSESADHFRYNRKATPAGPASRN